MNAEIRRVAFVALTLIGVLVIGTTYWQAWAAGDLAARQDNAIKSVAQFKIKRGLIRRRRRHGAGGEPAEEGRRPDVLLPALSAPRARLERHRLLDAGAVASRAGAFAERLPHRLERQPAHGARLEARRARGQDDRRQQRRADDRPAAPAHRPERARRQLRGGRRTRAVHGPRARDGDVAGVRREQGREGLPEDPQAARRLPARGIAAQPGHRRPLRAGLDVQARDRGGRARQREGPALDDVQRPRLLHRIRQACLELRHGQPVRDGDLPSGPSVLDQLRLLRGRQAARRARDPRIRPPLRHVLGSRSRAARRRTAAKRALRAGTAVLPEAGLRGRPRQARLRAGAARDHAAPDGDDRVGDRERRRAHAAVPRRARPRTRREGGATPRAERGGDRDEAHHRPGADRDDGRRRLGRNRDGRPDLRGRGGRKDRHRRDRRRGPEHDLVRRVRPGARARRSPSPWRSRTSPARAARQQRRSRARS